jgi:hypothetical protein
MQICGTDVHIPDIGNLIMDLPFIEEKIGENTFYRDFFHQTDSGDLHWHRDRESRIIESTHETDWKVQIDNELPKSLNEKVFIPMGVWHRLIKGNGDLRIKLIKIVN